MERIKRSCVILVMLSVLLLTAACAQSAAPTGKFPTQPIKILVGRSAGGSTDIVARAIQPYFSKYIGQPVVIENIPDSGGKIAFRQAFQSEPDGYTILFFGPVSDIMGQVVEKINDYSFQKFAPICNVGGGDAMMFISRKDSEIKTFEDMVAALKTRPVTIGKTTGINVGDLCVAMMLDEIEGLPIENVAFVPFGGGNESVTAALGGHVEIATPQPSVVAGLAANGEINSLVVFSHKPSISIPQAPTFVSMYPGPSNAYSMITGVVAPPGTPPEIVAILEDAFMKAMADPEFLAMTKDTIPLEPMRSQEFGKAINDLYNMVNEKLPIFELLMEKSN